MEAQGVIAESVIDFAITWESLGKGKQPKWDQNDQSIVIVETDVYPDLIYTAAYGAPKYVKYTSGAQLNALLMRINAVIDAKLAEAEKKKEGKNEAALPPGPPNPKQIGQGGSNGLVPVGKRELMAGQDVDQSLVTAPVRGGDLVPYETPKPPAMIGNKPEINDEPDVTSDNLPATTTTTTVPPTQEDGDYKYKVTVIGKDLRFIEGQEEKGAYSSGIKFLYKVSNNLTKVINGDKVDNTQKIWADVKYKGFTYKFEFSDFNVGTDDVNFTLGGNLLAQVLPSVELGFVPDPNSVYSKEKPELDLADVIKATSITLGNRTTPEIKAMQKKIEKEIEARETGSKQTQNKQSEASPNK